MQSRRNQQGGFVLLMLAFCAFALFGLIGLAFDIGRMYVVKTEAMAYVDPAAIAAARELDGTSAGGTRARNAALEVWARWNFGTTAFASPIVEFSTSRNGAFDAAPASWTNVAYARVTATAANVQLYFLPIVGTPSTGQAAHLAVAGQVPNTPQGIFPFSPIAHADYTTSADMRANAPDYGFTKGQEYTFRWPNKPSNAPVLCGGDNTPAWINKLGGSAWRGFITSHSASVIRDEIKYDYTDRAWTPSLDQLVTQAGGNGNKGTEASAMSDRVNQDTDNFSTCYLCANGYLARQKNLTAPYGNNRRVVTVIVNGGFSTSTGAAYAANQQNLGVGYAQFFLSELTYQNGQHDTFCAEYIGNNPCVGCKSTTAAPGDGSGDYIIRLVQ